MTATCETERSTVSGSLPFPGLRPFQARDHAYFFGRTRQIHALYRLLTRNHFVAVVGSSGSGKSSLVRAGLIPTLERDNIQADATVWQHATMQPGRAPIDRLAEALARVPSGASEAVFAARVDRINAILRASSHGLAEAMVHVLPDSDTQLVLIVDQFEELFRFAPIEAQKFGRSEAIRRRSEAVQFVQLLLAAARDHGGRVRIVATMRSDFIGDCAHFQELPEVVSDAQFLVPSLSMQQREEAIREQIRKAGATIDPALVQRLLIDSEEEEDQLPVLQHCLARLWMRASVANIPAGNESSVPPRRLRDQDYKDIGGLAGALSGHADEILASLPGKGHIVEKIFRALAEIDKEGRAIRRPRMLDSLIAETGESRDDIIAVLEKFSADDCSFVVPPICVADAAELPGKTMIDVGHEALLRRWKRVSGVPDATGARGDSRDIGWLRREQEDGERYHFLRFCVARQRRLPSDEVRGYYDWWDRRNPNEAWAARYGGQFDKVERLLAESQAASLRSKRWQWASYACAAVLIAGFVALVFLNHEQRRQAEAQTRQQATTFKAVTDAADSVSRRILEVFNAGYLRTDGAVALQKVASDIYGTVAKLPGLKDTPETRAIRIRWMLTEFDIEDALGKQSEAERQKLRDAEILARELVADDPTDRRWQKLLYSALYRGGDFDLNAYLAPSGKARDSNLRESAIAEYREAQAIADRLLKQQPTSSGQTSADAASPSVDQKFDLAFAINKVGEALQVKGDMDGAIAKFNEALVVAQELENSPKIDHKLQSATTKAKIAKAMLDKSPADLDGAYRDYSEAIGREQAIIQTDPTNNVVRSNLAASYGGRAGVSELRGGDLEADYRSALEMFSQLAEDDTRDTKWLSRLARVHREFGAALERQARAKGLPLDKAIEQYRGEVETREKLALRDRKNLARQRYLEESRARLRNAESSTTRADETSALPE
ncbi:MAG: AAA family ATPase [Pseudorhodoplanes sp.]